MGQQPNIELDYNDAPRRGLGPGPARPWRPRRPADIQSPGEMPIGGAFGVIGPDAGYALKLASSQELKLLPGEHRHDAEVAVAAVASARAGLDGRAPVADDVAVGMIVLGLDGAAHVDSSILAGRPSWIANVGHDAAKLRSLVADVPGDVLTMNPDELREHIAEGWIYRESRADS